MNKNMQFTFVILHYETVDYTEKCIESLTKLNVPDNSFVNIVVVDNGSKIKLIDLIDTYSKIHIVRSDVNLGFAKGNNLGIDYAREKFDSNYIICINNDVEILQKNFIEALIQSGINNSFDVMGPKINTLSPSIHQNPIYSVLDINSLRKKIRNLKLRRFLLKFRVDVIFSKVYQKLRAKSENVNQDNLNYQLHGSALIFAKSFFSHYEGFYPNTFMYGEEDFLKFMCDKKSLKMFYDENLEVLHKEEVTTKKLFSTPTKKRKFVYNHSIDSFELLKVELERE